MWGKTWKSRLIVATCLTGVMSAPVAAQTAAPADDSDLSDAIVVTARRTEERLQDVPISITVYTQEQLANRNIYNAGDLGIYTPSLATNSRYGPEKSSFSIRGFTQEANTSPSVGVYFADVVAPRAQGGTPSGNGAGVGSFFDLANVQILKGPQGTLFGRNTTGGAILLVPQKPTDRLEGYVEGTLGNYDTRRVQAVLNLPLADTFKVRLGVDRNKRDGYLINHSGIGPKDFNDTNYIAARLSIVADLTPDIENYIIATYSKSDTNGPSQRLVGCNRASASPFAVAACTQFDRQTARGDGFWDVEGSNPNPYAYARLKQWGVINTTTWRASDNLTVKNIASYQEFYETTAISISGDNFTVPPGLGPISGQPFQLIISRPAAGRHNTAQSTFTEEFQLQGTGLDDRLDWQAGAYVELSNPLGSNQGFTQILLACSDIYQFRCTSLFGPTSGSLSAPATETRFRNFGFYGQATYELTDKLSVTGGLRYTIDKVTQDAEIVTVRFNTGANTPTFYCSNLLLFPGTPAPGLPLGLGRQLPSLAERSQCHANYEQKSEKPTWLIGLDYKPIEDVLIYGKYARGYRQGLLNANAVGFETWRPEKVDAYELGLKASFHGAVSGYFNIAGFYNKFQDQQIQANATAKAGSGLSGVNIIVNAGRSTIKGVEIDASISPFAGFKVDLGYAYLDTRLNNLDLPVLDPNSPYGAVIPTAAAGGRLSLSPKNRYTITGTYRLPLDESIGTISIGATFTHTDQQVASRATLPQFGILPASNLLNLNASWQSIGGSPIDLAVFATNVTKKAFPVGVVNAYNSFGFEAWTPNEPRIYGLRVKYRFGG